MKFLAEVQRCASCGAPLPISLVSSEIVCTSCAARHAVDAELRQRLNAYSYDARALIHAELEARFHAAFFVQNERAAGPLLVGVVGSALMLVVGGLAVGVASHDPAGLPVSVLTLAFIPWAAFIASACRGWWLMFAIPRPEALLAFAVARCAQCGAVRTFSAGSATGTCEHCQGTLLVPVQLAAQLLRETGVRAAAAASTKRDALRAAEAAGHRFVQPLVLLVVLGVPVLLGLFAALVLLGGPRLPAAAGLTAMALPVVIAVPFVIRAPLAGARRRGEVDALADRLLALAGPRLTGRT